MKILNEIHLMRGAVISGVESIAIKDLPIPKIKDYEVLVKVKSVGICKTDIEILEGRHPSANELFAKNEPLIPGHEWSGVVCEAGRECKNFKIGDPVVSETTIPCGYCYYCTNGMINLCDNLKELGITKDGAMAEYVVVPCKILHKIPSNISFKEAALIEPTAVALHSIDRIMDGKENSLNNKSVIIFGDGPMGLLCLQAAKIKNPNKLYIVGKSEKKLKVAEKLGCDKVINTIGCKEEKEAINLIKKEIDKNKIDIIIDATSNNTFKDSAIYEALQIVKKGGTLMLLGLHDAVSININQIVFNELNIKGVLSSPGTWDDAIRFVSEKKIKISELITDEFTLKDVISAYEHVREKSNEVIKVVVNIQ